MFFLQIEKKKLKHCVRKGRERDGFCATMTDSSKKGKISLSGLTKGSSGTSFPSFRFSPENEEIEEIMLQDPTAGMFSAFLMKRLW